ncbi:MAG: transglycosylase SLT domain-containing protein [Blastocatellia bacterium]
MRYSREQLIDRIRQAARSIGFPEAVAIAQLARESANFRDDVVYGPFVGGSGERGLTQFIPGTWQRFGVGMHTNAYDPDASLSAWAGYTSYLMRLFNGDLTKVLQGYNGGEGNVQRSTVSAMARRYASEILQAAGTGSADRTGDKTDVFGFPLWAVVGVIALLAVVVLDD